MPLKYKTGNCKFTLKTATMNNLKDPRFEIISEKKLTGKRVRMTLAANTTMQLWQSFMPRRKEIQNAVTTDLISMQVYDDGFDIKDLDMNTPFYKWAATEVTDHNTLPDGMQPYTLPGGLYAVFTYTGDGRDAAHIFQYIYDTWLPTSGYAADNRPHFEVLGAKYKVGDANSEEEIWVPVRSM